MGEWVGWVLRRDLSRSSWAHITGAAGAADLIVMLGQLRYYMPVPQAQSSGLQGYSHWPRHAQHAVRRGGELLAACRSELVQARSECWLTVT